MVTGVEGVRTDCRFVLRTGDTALTCERGFRFSRRMEMPWASLPYGGGFAERSVAQFRGVGCSQARIGGRRRNRGQKLMLPNRDQIERVAYDRWLRRDRAHGRDRDDWVAAENELTFVLNYRALVEYQLDRPKPMVLGDFAARRCRLCERTSRHATFSATRPVVQGVGATSLLSAEICDECQADCRDPIAGHCQQLWKTLEAGMEGLELVPRHVDSIAVLKSLVTSASVDHARARVGLFHRRARMG